MTVYGYMWDSTTPQVIPATSRLNAYYFNGAYAHKPVTYGRGRIWIDVFGTDPGSCSILQIDGLDQAEISAMIGKAPGWLVKRNRISTGMIYVNRANLESVQDACSGLHYNVWLSTLDGSLPSVLPTPGGQLVAVQNAGEKTTGIHADRSVVLDKAFWEAHAS